MSTQMYTVYTHEHPDYDTYIKTSTQIYTPLNISLKNYQNIY